LIIIIDNFFVSNNYLSGVVNLRKKIICILILFFLIVTTLQTQTFALNISISKTINTKNDEEIFKDIEKTEGKLLIKDDIIGDIHVKYWEHVFNDLVVINDSILLHLDIETGNVIKYKKTWTDIDELLIDFDKGLFEKNNFSLI